MSEIRRGDIWMVDFGVPEDENDHKLHGIRPVVINFLIIIQDNNEA